MIEVYNEYEATVLALQSVSKEEVSRYGIIEGREIDKNLFKISNMIEKPDPSSAPTNLAIIGRYILTPDIFKFLEKTQPGKGGEIQLTDALKLLQAKRPVYGYLFNGKRYDAGDKFGFLQATVELALKNPLIKEEFKAYLQQVLNQKN